MKVVIQRVTKASVTINTEKVASIKNGLLVLLGIVNDDSQDDIAYLVRKITNLRIFNDEQNVMNKSLLQINGEVLVVSQFTLHAATKKGNRPSYIQAAKPEVAIPIYKNFLEALELETGETVQKGEFGADMQVELLNDGPVTIIIDSKNRI
jgi:D-tyrosyl-tRNA(Tyr) deacylase